MTLLDTDGVNGADTADSNGGYDVTTSDAYNLQVNIDGPVSRIVVEHTQDGGNNSGVRITDMYYDVSTTVVDDGPDGNDLLLGGDGNDTIYGEGGNDVIYGDNGGGAVGNELTLTIDSQDGAYNGAVLVEITSADGTVTVQTVTPDYDANVGNTFTVDLQEGDTVRVGITDGNGPTHWSNVGTDAQTTPVDADTVVLAFEDSVDADFNDVVITASVAGDVTLQTSIGDISGGGTSVGNEGNDTLSGDAGDDMLFGEGGDDTLLGGTGNDMLTGGDGADTISGGDDRDTIIGGDNGDVVDGGSGSTAAGDVDDFDTLDLTGEGPFRVVNETEDADGNSTSGTVEFLNPDGTVSGSLDFTEIEAILGDRVNTGPDANDDSASVDEDDSVVIDVLGNDTYPEGDALTVIEATSPDGGVTINADGTLTFAPDENFNGDTTISYTIRDEAGNTDTATVSVHVAPVNDAPDAVNDTDTTNEDTPITLDVLANDTDVDGDALTVTGATVPAAQGTVEIVGNQVVFTPAENFNGLATISYSISDGNGGTDTAIHEVDVLPVNDAPVAVDDIAQTEEDTSVVIDLIANDTDVDGDTLTIGTVSVPAEQGTVVDNGDGTVTFTPAPNYTGPAQITYTVVDGNGGEDVGGATVNVFIEGVNDGPDAVNDAVTTAEDTPITIDALANDTDVEGDALTITGASVPAQQGSVEVVGNQLVFTPAPDFNGEATITYSITDGNGGTDTAEVAVTVTPVNDDPVAVDDVETTDEDQPITIDLIANDTDVDGDPLSVGSVSVPPEQGSVVDNGDGTVTFTPAPDFNGPATITYTVIDGQGGEDEGQAVVSVGAINDGPVAVDDADTTPEDTPITVDLTANDTDADGDALSVISATVPAEQGSLVNNGDGTVTFTPAPNFNGDATITYEISDGNGGTDIAVLVVTVTPVNDDPLAVDDAVTTAEDTSVEITPLANDTDVDGDTLTVTQITQPANGEAVLNADGTITYTPDPDFSGEDTLTYTVSDGNGGTDTATVTITVSEVNDGPDAVDDTAQTNNLTPVTIAVLDNDTDPENDPLTVTEATVDTGTVSINPDGTLDYTPEPGFGGVATITYTITDNNGGFDTATVTVGVNDGIVEGTAGDDLIDVTYMGDPEGDMVDNNDEFLPGEGPQDDIILAGVGNDTVNAGEGNDEVYGEDGNDVLNGEAGDDYLSGGEGDDIISGGAGDDVLDAGQGADQLFGEDGNDTLLGGPGTELMDGGAGDDTIIGGNNDDEIIGGTGNDTIEGNDTVRANQGNDFIEGGLGNDTLNGGDGEDQIYGEDGNDTLSGGDDNDYLSGCEGDDILRGNDGDDVLDAGQGRDQLYGGAGNDTLLGGPGTDLMDGGSDDDTIIGGNNDDTILGGSGDDVIEGNDGNDTITAGDGSDSVEGGEGDDIIDTSGHAPAPDLGYPGVFPADTNPPFGGPTDDIDFVDGGAGNDTISTGDDADTIDGGDGDDRIVGGEGSDTIDGGAGNDTIYAGIDPALGLPDNLDIADVDGDLVTNNGMDVVNGGDGNDTIFGADDDDVLNGDAGDDFIDGGVDDDTISGGTGNDTLIGGQGADTISGGDDRDTIIVDNAEDAIGDVVDGGTGSTAAGDVDDFDVLDLTGSGPLRIVGETVDADGNSTSGTVEFLDGVGGNVIGTLEFTEIESIVPCFTPGTSIATPRGEVLVEDLMVGDKIITRDNGIQEIRWIGAKRMDGRELQNNPHLQPVLIQKGSLGNGLPERDMLVSPNHRMLVNNDRVSLYFEENEVLVSAKHLVNPSEGVQSIASMGTTYIHFMFDNHEVVLSNGAWTESFQPGDYSLKGIGNSQRNEIFELFPELQGEAGREAYASARLTLKKHEAKLLFK